MVLDWNTGWEFTNQEGITYDVELPHDAMLHEKRDPNCHNGVNTGFFPGGKYKYEKRFLIQTEEVSKDIRVRFEAVYRNARILLNGIEICTHVYGYTEFEVNLSGKIQLGENIITVLVDNSLEPNSRWYSGSGIIRPVSMIIREKVHPSILIIKTVSIMPTLISVVTDANAILKIISQEGESVNYKEKTCEQIIERNISDKPICQHILEIQDAQLWSESTPYLYTCVLQMQDEELKSNFGIRTLSWDAKSGLQVNGERVLLRGGCIHHDNGVLGACGYGEAEARRVRILKEAGYNALRIAHNPASRALLDACDKLGMYVMDEAFDGWYVPKTYHDYGRDFWENWKRDIRAMVEKDINHPSVIMYSIGNEVSETASEEGVNLAGEMSDYVKTLDASRPTTAGINVLLNVYTNMGVGVYKDSENYQKKPLPPKTKGYKEKKTGSAFFNAMAGRLGKLMFFMSAGRKGEKVSSPVAEKLDILGLNYAGSRFEPDLKKYPNRLMVASETMVTDLPYNWEYVKKYPAILGDFVWAAWDYLGEACIGDYTYQDYSGLPLLAGSGTIDITGNITAEAYFQQVIWGIRKNPYIGITPLNHNGKKIKKSAWRFTNAVASWNWPGYEGQMAKVEVYSSGKYVKLVHNAKVLGTKKLKEYRTIFKVPYQKGELTAYALDEQKRIISSHTIKSGTEGLEISAVPEMIDDGKLVFLPIEFVDNSGLLRPDIEQKVKLTIEDKKIKLIGFGSALAKTDDNYLGNEFTSYRGRVLAVLKLEDDCKEAIVTISSDHVKSKKVKISRLEL